MKDKIKRYLFANIKRSLIIINIIILIPLSIISITWITNKFRDRIIEEYNQYSQNTILRFSESVKYYLKIKDFPGIQRYVHSVIIKDEKSQILSIYDNEFNLLASTDYQSFGKSELSEEMDIGSEVKRVEDDQEIKYYYRITDSQNNTLGYIKYTIDISNIKKELLRVRILSWLIIVIFLIINLLFMSFSFDFITRPICNLANRMDNYREPNKIESEHDTHPVFEIRILSNAFNKMIKEIKDYEVKLERQSKLAAIGQTTSMLAHDVRKPFSQIKNILNMMDKIKNDSGLLKKAQDDVDRSINNVESMISDILDFSREVKLETEPTPITSLLGFSIRECAQCYPNSEISISYDIQNEKMPLVDGQRITRVFSNIIGNGIEAIRDIGKKEEGNGVGIGFLSKDCQSAWRKYKCKKLFTEHIQSSFPRKRESRYGSPFSRG